MDVFFTKLFLANIVAMFSTAWIDRLVLKDALERLPGGAFILGSWAFLTICSIPAWLVYVIVTL